MGNYRKYTCFLAGFFGFLPLLAQPLLTRFDTVRVEVGSVQLKNPWAGGINFSEWSAIDIDMDGYKDLVVFDKSGEKLRVFLNDKIAGIASYTHAPQYQDQFPYIDEWCIFYDYNCDNKPDLFTYATGLGAMRLYKNTSTPGHLQFNLVSTQIKSDYNPGGSPQLYNLYCNAVAIPGLADVDKDGDMDVLSFSYTGITVQYHKNQSMELYNNCDSLVFDMVDECWGDFDENACITHLNSGVIGCAPFHKYLQAAQQETRVMGGGTRHAGSCIMCYDADGDKDIDIVMGDISCDSLNYYHNGGSTHYAHIDLTYKTFPSQYVASFKSFPCSYFLDLDNDGKRDLIAAPNITASENYQSVWQYKNVNTDSSPVFQFVKKNFFQEEMIELGEGAYPAAFDYEGDGDLDMLVGNFGYYSPGSPGNYSSRLALFLNTGTPQQPKFTLATNDFQNFSTVNIINKSPALADFDNDGDMDLFIGSFDGRLSYYENTAGLSAPAAFVLKSNYTMNGTFLYNIDIGNTAAPFAVDVDRDGVKDLLVGGKDGYIGYYRNTGTPQNPVLTLINNHWGGVKTTETTSYTGNAIPFLYDQSGTYKLFVGSERGYIYLYGDIESHLNSGNFALLDSIYLDLVEGQHVAPCFADFNKDGKTDMVLGNYSGGLAYFKGQGSLGQEENLETISGLSLYPNPAQQSAHLKFNDYNIQQKEINLYDLSGRLLKNIQTSSNTYELELNELQTGMYLVQVVFKGKREFKVTRKLMKN